MNSEARCIEGTIVTIAVDHLPGERAAKPMWLWCSDTQVSTTDLTWWWQSYLRRFDIEHTLPGSSGRLSA